MQQHSVHIVYVVAIQRWPTICDTMDETIYGRGRRFTHVSRLSFWPVFERIILQEEEEEEEVSSWESSLSYSFGCCEMRNCDDELRQAAHSFSPVCRPSSSHFFFFFFAFVYNYYSFRYLSKMAHTLTTTTSLQHCAMSKRNKIKILFIYLFFILRVELVYSDTAIVVRVAQSRCPFYSRRVLFWEENFSASSYQQQ